MCERRRGRKRDRLGVVVYNCRIQSCAWGACVFITAGPSTCVCTKRVCLLLQYLLHTKLFAFAGLSVCFKLQYLVQSCSRGGGEDSGGHVLRETTSPGPCGLVCPSRTGTREEPGTQVNTGCACFPWFLSFGNRTQNSRVAGAKPNHQPIGGSDPNHQGIWCVCLLLQYL